MCRRIIWTATLNWVKEQGFGGIGLWVLDDVNDPPERWQVLRSSLGNKRN